MKKKYFTPEVIEVELGTISMLATSSGSEYVPIKPGQGGSAGAGSSRGEWGNLW